MERGNISVPSFLQPSVTPLIYNKFEKEIHPQQCQDAWNTQKHSYVKMCINEIRKKLFGGSGLVPVQGSERLFPNTAFSSFIKRNLEPLSEHAFIALNAFGVIPIALGTNAKLGLGDVHVEPYVPCYGSYKITTYEDEGQQQFKFYWLDGRKADNVYIYHDFGFDPDLDGTLNSNFYSIASFLNFINEMHAHATTAERINAVPPLVTGYNKAGDVDRDQKLDEGYYAGTVNEQCEEEAAHLFRRNIEQRELMKQNIRAQAEQYNLDPREYFGVKNTSVFGAGRQLIPKEYLDFQGYTMPWARTLNLPTSRNIANVQLPKPRGDLTNLSQQIMDVVCGVLNVPRSVLSSSSNVKAGVAVVAESLMRTVMQYADILGKIVTQIYNQIFKKASIASIIRSKLYKKAKYHKGMDIVELLTEDDLYDIKEKSEITFIFDLPPFTTREHTKELYLEGIISYSLYADTMIRLNNMSRSQIANTKDIFTKEERKQMLLKPTPNKKTGSTTTSGAGKKRKRESDPIEDAQPTDSTIMNE